MLRCHIVYSVSVKSTSGATSRGLLSITRTAPEPITRCETGGEITRYGTEPSHSKINLIYTRLTVPRAAAVIQWLGYRLPKDGITVGVACRPGPKSTRFDGIPGGRIQPLRRRILSIRCRVA